MVKKFTRRTLALVLCIVMLVSCWVFTSPTANAAATQAAGNYSVQLYIYVDDDDGKSWVNGKDAQTATITVTYKSDNGYGSTTGTTVYDYSDDLYTCGTKIYKTLTVSDIPGFPTNVDITHDYGWADGCSYHLKTISICNTAVISNLNEELKSGGVGNSSDSYSATIPANKYPSATTGGSISASPTALTLDGGRKLTVAVSHFGLTQEGRIVQSKEALDWLKEDSASPLLFCGDFNAVPDSQEIQYIYASLHEAFGGQKNVYTFSTTKPSSHIDYIFANDKVTFKQNATVIQSKIASDHFPIMVDFTL